MLLNWLMKPKFCFHLYECTRSIYQTNHRFTVDEHKSNDTWTSQTKTRQTISRCLVTGTGMDSRSTEILHLQELYDGLLQLHLLLLLLLVDNDLLEFLEQRNNLLDDELVVRVVASRSGLVGELRQKNRQQGQTTGEVSLRVGLILLAGDGHLVGVEPKYGLLQTGECRLQALLLLKIRRVRAAPRGRRVGRNYAGSGRRRRERRFLLRRGRNASGHEGRLFWLLSAGLSVVAGHGVNPRRNGWRGGDGGRLRGRLWV